MADVTFNGFPVITTVPDTDVILVGNDTDGVRNASKANFLKELNARTAFEGKEMTIASGLNVSTRRCMVSQQMCFVVLGFTASSNVAAYGDIATIQFNVGTAEYFPMFDITSGETVWAYAYEHSIKTRSALTAGHVYTFSATFI